MTSKQPRLRGGRHGGDAVLLPSLPVDRCYAEDLIEPGRSDAAAIAEDLERFL